MKLILLPVLLLAVVLTPSKVSAHSFTDSHNFSEVVGVETVTPEISAILQPKPAAKPIEVAKPQPIVYTVLRGDNLTKIGTAYNVEWQRLWAKNTQLTQPDLIHIGDQITIPFPDEQLSRELPAAVNLPKATPGVLPRSNYIGGNTYDYGYCTWYVKDRRGSSLPNGLGNANTWYSRAGAMGMPIGSTPKAGAVGTTTRGKLGHVVYVESVNSDGSINISEMNSEGFGITSRRTTNASEFVYIY